ncbi:DUF397 domain-containing protein [Saccharopolyspora taberi]|uniref:DUF397 domain-containing protein n=1 Tax=Saccharopolyspora taberi TaxID=60895 RepID=A0ABN3V8N1_9PSEU
MTPPKGWRKSSRSHQHTDCVEVGRLGGGAAVRDTKNRAAGYFTTTGRQWQNFLTALKNGNYDR